MNSTESPLRALARVHEIDRQLYINRFRLTALTWVGGPVVVLMVGFVAHRLWGHGVGDVGDVLTGLGGVVTVFAGAVAAYRGVRRRVGELEGERAGLVG